MARRLALLAWLGAWAAACGGGGETGGGNPDAATGKDGPPAADTANPDLGGGTDLGGETDAGSTDGDAKGPGSGGTGGDLAPGYHKVSGTFGPRAGSYTVYVPKGLVLPAPLVFGLHGTGGTGMQQDGFEKSIADARGWLLAAPDAGKSQWNINPRAGEYAGMKADVDFAFAVLGDVLASYDVDTKRLWAAGFSQGAFFVYWLALTFHQDTFAGYVAYAGRIPAWGQPMQFSASKTAPGIPGLIVHGMKDTTVPFADGKYSYDTLKAAGHVVTPLWFDGAHMWLGSLNPMIGDWLAAHAR